MAVKNTTDLSNVKSIRRLKFCTSCNEYNYHIYYIDYPARIFICEMCNTETKTYSSK